METYKTYINRLSTLYGYLRGNYYKVDNLQQRKNYNCDKNGASIEHFSWAFKDLPKLFPEWKYRADNSPYLINYEGLNTLSAAAVWFNLNFDTLSHLFVPGYQDSKYGGEILSENATPTNLASNIYEYLIFIEDEREAKAEEWIMKKEQRKQKSKIYKLKTNYYEKGNDSDIMSRMRA